MDVKIYVARHGQDTDNANGIINGRRDEQLTELGKQQAKDVARKMSEAGFRLFSPSSSSIMTPSSSSSSSYTMLSAIYSSPLRRARETAEIFAGALSSDCCDGDNASDEDRQGPPPTGDGTSIEVEILDDLVERDFGIMTGQPTSSILEMCDLDDVRVLATDAINYFLDPPNAETFPDLIDRAHRLLFHIQTIITKGSSSSSSSSSSPSSILLVTHGDFGKMLYAAYYNLRWEEVLRQFHFGNSEVLLLAKDSPPNKAHVFETLQFNP